MFAAKAKTDPTVVYRKISIPSDGFAFGEIHRVTNYSAGREDWHHVFRRSEPCPYPGDESLLKSTIDLNIWDPTPLNFNPAPAPPFSRPQMKKRYGWDDHSVDYAMARGLLAKPTVRVARASEAEGARLLGDEQFWAASDVQKLDELIARLFPAALPKQGR